MISVADIVIATTATVSYKAREGYQLSQTTTIEYSDSFV